MSARRSELTREAARLFAERGYHPTSVADIVASLGVGKGVFYWYFASKEELLTELLKASNHELRKRQQQAIGAEADPVRRIELGMRATLEWFHLHREYFAIIQFAATDETFAPVLARNREISIADTIRHLKDGIVRPDANQVGHESDDEWLRNGLTIADWQRPIGVGVAT